MKNEPDFLDPDRPGAVRLGVDEARALGEAALGRIGYPAEECHIITDQLIDSPAGTLKGTFSRGRKMR